MSGGKVLLLVFGIIVVIVSLGMLFGGGVIIWAENSFKDSEGYYDTGSININRNVYAVITPQADIHIGSIVPDMNPWPNLKITATDAAGNTPVFVGIANSADIRNYLNGAAYDEVNNFTVYPKHLDFTSHAGTGKPGDPAAQNFWAAKSSGSGTQTVKWDLVSGEYSILIMNSDVSTPVNVNVSMGFLFPDVLKWVAISLIIMGVIGLGLGGLMIWMAARRTGLTPNNNNPA